MISYKTANRAIADEIYTALESAGLTPWMDYRGIEPGERWRDELLKQVRTCSAFVALLTPEYVQSEHCRMELFIARSRGCAILPVMLENCFDLLETHEETKGLADIFMIRLYRLSVVGLSISHDEAIQRIVLAAGAGSRELKAADVYVAYCNDEAPTATRVARELETAGISTWIATQNCRVGDNWRQAQARALMKASVQIVVLDETIARSEVLRTEIMLAEAFGLPVYTMLGETLSADESAVARVMKELRAADITYRRLTDVQPYRCDPPSVEKLARRLRSRTMRP